MSSSNKVFLFFAIVLLGVLTALIVSFFNLRNARWCDALEDAGFEFTPVRGNYFTGFRAQIPADIDGIFRASTGIAGKGIIFEAAVLKTPLPEVWFLRHSTQLGKHETIRIAMVMRTPVQWPRVHIRRKNSFETLKDFLGASRRVKLENEDFNRSICVKSSDENFAMLLLGPELQQAAMLLGSADLIIGCGGLCIVEIATLTSAELIRNLLSKIASIARAIPPELDQWENSSSAERVQLDY